jgi:hypothetical protein
MLCADRKAPSRLPSGGDAPEIKGDHVAAGADLAA